MRTRLTSGRLAGTHLEVATSALVVAVLIGWTFYGRAGIAGAFVGGYAYLVSILAHEAAHTTVARAYGIEVLRIRLSLVGGYAELEDQPSTPRADAAIAVAGPATTLLVALVCFTVATVLQRFGVTMSVVWLWVAQINLGLGVFNLLPGLPLDGGRLVSSWFWHRSGQRLAGVAAGGRGGQAVGMCLVVAGLVAPFVNARLSPVIALLGYWLLVTATGLARNARLELLNVTVAAGFEPAEVLDVSATVADAGGWQPWVLLSAGEGSFMMVQRRRLPREDRAAELRALSTPIATVAVTEPLTDATRGRLPAVVIDTDGRPIGVATLATLQAAARRI